MSIRLVRLVRLVKLVSRGGQKNQNVKSQWAHCIFPLQLVIQSTLKNFRGLGGREDPPLAPPPCPYWALV